MFLYLMSQMPPAPPDSWERVGIITFLALAVFLVAMAFLKEWVVTGTRYKAKEEECLKRSEENRTLWQEKVADARKSESIAEAYIEIWEREHGK